jgi:hypothetical protein
MKIERWSFVMGIAFCMAVAGCMMAATTVNPAAGARYEVHWTPTSSSFYVVLDTQTGSTVVWGQTPLGEIRTFTAAE